MKREIKFRGQPTGMGGIWMVGIGAYKTYTAEHLVLNAKCDCVEVVHLCQYTGLKDCNGKEIYEGDLLEVANHKRDKECIADVIFLDGAFWLHFPNEDLLNIKEVSECWVVIGNIHDCPELIKTE